MTNRPHIAIDAMGGDDGLRVMMAGVAEARRRHDGLRFSLFGDEARIKAALDNHPNLRAASEVVHCDEEPPPPTHTPSTAKQPEVRLMPPVEEKVEVAVEKLMPFVLPIEKSEPGVVVPMPTLPPVGCDEAVCPA